jgi:sulfur carrier protein ThiS
MGTGETVTFAQTGNVQPLAFRPGLTIKQALAELSWSIEDGQQLRLNGTLCTDFDTELKANDQVLVVGEIAGG